MLAAIVASVALALESSHLVSPDSATQISELALKTRTAGTASVVSELSSRDVISNNPPSPSNVRAQNMIFSAT